MQFYHFIFIKGSIYIYILPSLNVVFANTIKCLFGEFSYIVETSVSTRISSKLENFFDFTIPKFSTGKSG